MKKIIAHFQPKPDEKPAPTRSAESLNENHRKDATKVCIRHHPRNLC